MVDVKLNAEFAEAQRAAEYLFSTYRSFSRRRLAERVRANTTLQETTHHLVAAKGRAKSFVPLWFHFSHKTGRFRKRVEPRRHEEHEEFL